MNDAMAVRVVERAGDRDGEVHCFVHRELLLAVEPRAERLAVDERHHVEEQPVGLAAVEQRQEIADVAGWR